MCTARIARLKHPLSNVIYLQYQSPAVKMRCTMLAWLKYPLWVRSRLSNQSWAASSDIVWVRAAQIKRCQCTAKWWTLTQRIPGVTGQINDQRITDVQTFALSIVWKIGVYARGVARGTRDQRDVSCAIKEISHVQINCTEPGCHLFKRGPKMRHTSK